MRQKCWIIDCRVILLVRMLWICPDGIWRILKYLCCQKDFIVPTSNTIDKAKLKTELEALGRVLRLKWHFRNEENEFDLDQFKPKSTVNLRNKDAAIEVYMSSLEEKLMKIEIPKDKYKNLTIKERQVLYDLKNNKSIVIKSADKVSTVVVQDREDYIKEAEIQLGIVMPMKKSLMTLNHLLAPHIER